MKKILFIGLFCCSLLMHAQQLFIYDEQGNQIIYTENPCIKYIGIKDSVSKNELSSLITSLEPVSNYIKTINGHILKLKIKEGKSTEFTNIIESNPIIEYLSSELYAPDSTVMWAPNQILLKIKEGLSISEILDSLDINYSGYRHCGANYNSYLLTLNGSIAFEASNLLFESGMVVYAEPSFYVIIESLSTDDYDDNPYFDEQWSVNELTNNINVLPAWDITGGDGAKVAVIDVGVDLNNPDLEENLIQGFDATNNEQGGGEYGGYYQEYNNHGTRCAGIISSSNNNICGVGIAYTSKLIPIKAMYYAIVQNVAPPDPPDDTNDIDLEFYCNYFWIIDAINFADTVGADIISCSWSLGNYSPTVIAKINEAITNGRNGKGCVVIFSTGNNGGGLGYLASLPDVIATGSISPCGKRVIKDDVCNGITMNYSSNYGNELDVVAPGVKIPTTDIDQGCINNFGGTSSATPHVAGVAALILSVNPCLTQAEVREIIETTCTKVRPDLYTFISSPDHPHGTWNNQVGYGLINAYEAVNLALDGYEFNKETTISTATTWNNPKYVSQDISINSSGTLTISNTVQFASSASIIVEPGGKLIVDGAILTNKCAGDTWQGIQILGNSSVSQLSFGAQGIVELRNGAVISNAVCGIKVWDGTDPNSSGGIVRAANASFINNATAVEFGEYHNINNGYELGNRSYFTNCIFTINNDYFTSNELFQAHVKLNSIKNVRFNGCIFSNERNILPSITAERTVSNMGILAFNSGFSVKPSCNVAGVYPCPPEQQNRSSFNGFSYGIYVSGSEGNYTVNVDQTDFDNNVIGINLSATTNASVLRSQFNIGYTDFLPKQTGIIASNSTGFRFEENQFAGNTEFLGTSVGIKIRNSGENSNQTYKNDFSNLTIGEEFIGMNRSKRDLFIGLQALCNNHTDIAQSDILVEMNQNGVYDGIRYYQGGRDDGTMLYLLSAGNLFSNSATTNYDNNTMQYIDYQYSANDPREMPTVNSMVYQDLVTVSNSCLSRIDALTMSQISQQYNTARNSCISLLYNYNQQIDGGNTEQLLDDIQGEWSDDVWKIREELLAKSPYVSREVLKETAEKNLLPQAIYLEICIANVDATRSQEFLDFLRYEIPNPLPEYMLDIIRENWGTKSLRTVLESNLAHYSSKKDNLLDMMLNNSLNDSITNRTNVRSMLTERGYYSDYFTIAEGYIEENDFENAYNTMYDLSLNYYKLTEEQETEINDFEEYIAFRENLFVSDSSNIYQLTASEIDNLIDYTQTHTGRGRILAQNILCVLYDICEEEELLENKDHFTPNSNTYSSAKTTSDQIEVMPNPAQNYTTFKWDFDLLQGNALLKIYEQSGKQIETQVLSSAQGQWVWDTRKVSDGIYTYSVTSNSMLIGSGKVIVKK